MLGLNGSKYDVMRRRIYAAATVLLLFILLILFRKTVLDALAITAGGAAAAFLLEPLARLYERKLSRSLSALCVLLTCLCALLLALWLLVPILIEEAALLAGSLPQSVMMVRNWIHIAAERLQTYLPGIRIPAPSVSADQLPELAKNTIGFAGGVADFFYRFSLAVVLCYFFLCDRRRLMIRLEMLIPRAKRTIAVQMGNAVCRELRVYLRGQGMIAAIVGMLSFVGLAMVGVRSALVLGIMIGILNMIPYFGPLLGAVPALLMALGEGWKTALGAAAVLWLVQQIDSTLISPRIMSSLSGVSPAVVLLAIFVGSGLGGIVGMLLAMPAVMTYRTVFRVFVQRYENV